MSLFMSVSLNKRTLKNIGILSLPRLVDTVHEALIETGILYVCWKTKLSFVLESFVQYEVCGTFWV